MKVGVAEFVETVRVELADPPDLSLNVEGDRVTVGPPLIVGVRVGESLTEPANPFRLRTVSVVIRVTPGGVKMKLRAAETRKSRVGGGDVGEDDSEINNPATAVARMRLARSSNPIPVE